MTKYYAEVKPDGHIVQQHIVDELPPLPEELGGGPAPEEPVPEPSLPGNACQLLAAPLSLLLGAAPSETAVPKLEDDMPVWVEESLADMQAAAIARSYLDVDAVHAAAVGNRATEYQEAERAAREFAAAGFVGVADSDVHDFALDNPTGQVQTDQWAAEQIISRADAFRSAQKAMRSQRFKRQGEWRAATTPAECRAVTVLWDQFITNLRAMLGLPPV